MSRSAEQLDKIVARLREGVTTSYVLADHVGVSTRTIFRRIAALKRSGVRVEGEAGIGYMLRERRRDHA